MEDLLVFLNSITHYLTDPKMPFESLIQVAREDLVSP